MKTIFTLPPSKSMPAGFYWEGDTNDSQFIDAYEFYQKILRSGMNGSFRHMHIDAQPVLIPQE